MLITGIALENNTIEKLTSHEYITNIVDIIISTPCDKLQLLLMALFKSNAFFIWVEGVLLQKSRIFDILFPVQQKLC